MAGTRRLPVSALVVVLASLVTVTLGQTPIRINCGSEETKADSAGRVWQADRYYSSGSRTWTERDSKVNIASTSDDFLYLSERWQVKGGNHLRYNIPVPKGEYNIRLLFAENYETAPNKRVFDVKIEGRIPSSLKNLDIYKMVGKNQRWDSPFYRAAVDDGRLTIEFIDRIGNPKVGGIEVIPLAGRNAAPSNMSLHPDIRFVAPVKHVGIEPMGLPWADSYSREGKCYCDKMTTYDHEIENFRVNTPVGWKTVREICELLGPGPGRRNGDPIYNDVQCGNGPPNNAKDEHTCPGRVDLGYTGCGQIGPKWNFDSLPTHPERHRFFIDVGGDADDESLIASKQKTWTYDTRTAGGNRVGIKNNGGIPASVYETHRSGEFFEYVIEGFEAAAPYQVSLGFAEVWPPNCKANQRVMSIRINGNPYPRLDVWKEASENGPGCGGALNKKYVLTANGKGQFVISVGAIVENAMLSSIDIVPLL